MLHSGVLACPSRALALDTLSRRGLVPVLLEEGGDGKRAEARSLFQDFALWRYKRKKQASSRELLRLTQSLAALLRAGLTVDRALQISSSLAPSAAARVLAENLLQSVRSGKSLGDSLAASGQNLPTYFVSMVEAGEVGGSLPETLARLGELMRRQNEMQERIRSALIYPSMLAAVVVATLIILLVFVLPRFEQLFMESETPLPWSTRFVLQLGRLAADYWWVGCLGAGAAVAGIEIWRRSKAGRLQLDRWLLRSRLTLGLPVAIDTARLLYTLAGLCQNGAPLSVALRVARGAVGNRALLVALSGVSQEIQAGESFSVAFNRAGCFPAVAVQLARVGEETGRLEELLLSAASVLEEETHRLLERLLSLLVPMLTIGMGLVVAGLIGSVLIGLLSINDMAF